MMRPPCGFCAFMMRIASRAQRNAAVMLMSSAAFQSASVMSSVFWWVGMPALFTSTSSRP